MLHKNAADKFSFESSKFTIQRSKESTGRVVFWNMGILNSFTLEASDGGSNLGTRAFTHFTTGDYQSLGRYSCETLHDLYDPDPPMDNLRCTILQRLVKESNANDPVNIALSDYSSLSSSGASDSEESVTEIDGTERSLSLNLTISPASDPLTTSLAMDLPQWRISQRSSQLCPVRRFTVRSWPPSTGSAPVSSPAGQTFSPPWREILLCTIRRPRIICRRLLVRPG